MKRIKLTLGAALCVTLLASGAFAKWTDVTAGWQKTATELGFASPNNNKISSLAINPATGNLLVLSGVRYRVVNPETGVFIRENITNQTASTTAIAASEDGSLYLLRTDGFVGRIANEDVNGGPTGIANHNVGNMYGTGESRCFVVRGSYADGTAIVFLNRGQNFFVLRNTAFNPAQFGAVASWATGFTLDEGNAARGLWVSDDLGTVLLHSELAGVTKKFVINTPGDVNSGYSPASAFSTPDGCADRSTVASDEYQGVWAYASAHTDNTVHWLVTRFVDVASGSPIGTGVDVVGGTTNAAGNYNVLGTVASNQIGAVAFDKARNAVYAGSTDWLVQWLGVVDEYTLLYSAATGGTLSGDAQQSVAQGLNGTAVTAVANPDSVFVKWLDNEDTNPVRQEIDVQANVFATAQFEQRPIKVTFERQAGTYPEPATRQVTDGEAYGALPTTSRPGHDFKGWYTAAENGDLVEATTTVTELDVHTLYAQWEPRSPLTIKTEVVGSPSLAVGTTFEVAVSATNNTIGVTPLGLNFRVSYDPTIVAKPTISGNDLDEWSFTGIGNVTVHGPNLSSANFWAIASGDLLPPEPTMCFLMFEVLDIGPIAILVDDDPTWEQPFPYTYQVDTPIEPYYAVESFDIPHVFDNTATAALVTVSTVNDWHLFN